MLFLTFSCQSAAILHFFCLLTTIGIPADMFFILTLGGILAGGHSLVYL